jgi:hypothetical protein
MGGGFAEIEPGELGAGSTGQRHRVGIVPGYGKFGGVPFSGEVDGTKRANQTPVVGAQMVNKVLTKGYGRAFQ